MQVIASAALSLAEMGFYPVKLHYPIFKDGVVGCSCEGPDRRGCESQGKHPVGNQWGKSATQDPEILQERFSGQSWNVGIVLGICFGIPEDQAVIDVEDDSPEGRALADVLLKDYPCPTYTSGKSLHRIYRWSPDLPPVANLTIAGLEFRFGGRDLQTQSVAPPSIHKNGSEYRWLDGLSPKDVPIPTLPEHVVKYVCEEYARQHEARTNPSSGDARKFKSPLGKISPGGRHHALLKYANNCWRMAYSMNGINGIEEQETLDQVWMWLAGANAYVCSPPKTESELGVIFNSSRDFMRSEFMKEIDARIEQAKPNEDGAADSFTKWLHDRGIRMKPDESLEWNEQSYDRTDAWVSDWTIEFLTKSDEQLVRVNFKKPELSVTMKQVEFDKYDLFARRVQTESGGAIVLTRSWPLWEWKTIWHGRKNGKKNGITRGLQEYLISDAVVIAREEGGLNEQVEDIILGMSGSLGPLMVGLEKILEKQKKFSGRMKLDPQGENLMLMRLPEDPGTGWYYHEEEIGLYVKAPEVIRIFKNTYGKLDNANKIVADTLTKDMGFEKTRISRGAMEGRWYVKRHSVQPEEKQE
jgi:hypothetical protein